MGNIIYNKSIDKQYLTIQSAIEQQQYQQYEEDRNCLGCKYTITVKQKLKWQKNFIYNCQKLLKVCPWAQSIKQFITCKKCSRIKFLKQFNDLKYQERQIQPFKKSDLTAADIQSFKSSLRKSVLINYADQNTQIDQGYMDDNLRMSKRKNKQSLEEQFNRYTIVKDDNIIQQPRESSRSTSMKSFIDDTMNNIFQNQSQTISKSGIHSLQIFIKFTILLQKQLNHRENKLCHIIRIFYNYVYKKYSLTSEIAITELDQLIKQLKIFLILLRNAVEDFYNTKSFQDLGEHSNYLVSNSENILTTVTTIVFKNHKFYNFIYTLMGSLNKDRKAKFEQILEKLNGKQPNYFEISPQFCLMDLKTGNQANSLSVENIIKNLDTEANQQHTGKPYSKCITALNKMKKAKTPISKMKAIVQCAEKITQSISDYYDRNHSKPKRNILDADQVLSIFSYVIVTAKMQDIHTHLYMIEKFATDHQMISDTGYYYSVIIGAIQQLENTTTISSLY